MKTRFFLVIALGLLAVGESRSEKNTLPLVRSSKALGENLLEKLGVVAEAAGYHVEIADIRAQSGGIQLVLPGLVLTPPAGGHPKSIRLPVVIAIRREEQTLISFHVITHPRDPLSNESSIRIVLRQRSDEEAVAEKATKLIHGWNTPTLSWVVDRDRASEEFVVEIIPVSVGRIKVTFPQALLLSATKK